jgi:cytochrome c oxidase cbb3-type subunit 2
LVKRLRLGVHEIVSRVPEFVNQLIAALVVFVAISLLACENRSAGVHAAEISQSDHHFGRRVYELNCAVCHGVQGDGNGPAAGMLVTRPRDFRSGIFKFRSTPSGSLPSDQDLFRTITDGVRWTGMIARPDLNDFELRAVVEYIKTFSPRFATSKPLAPVNITSPPQATAGLLLQGKNLFRDADCGTCHGDGGRGDGLSAADMKDDWGWPIRLGDITWRPLKRGSSLEQIYLTIATGVSGTPMPAFAEALAPAQIWAIVFYLESLVPAGRRLSPARILGEEQQGRMALHMSGMMGMGRQR